MERLLVVGATGAQGGSVARHLLDGGRFAVRCLVRDPRTERAQALEQAGAELVQGDLEDADGLRRAVRGCHGVFGVTNYWEHFDREYDLGRTLVDAVAEARIPHLVLSTLPSAAELSGGALEVPHFDLKAQLEQYARSLNIPVTFVHVAFYYENFLIYFAPKRQADGTWVFGFPQGETPLAAVAVEDIGGVVAPLFARTGAFLGRTVGIVGDDRPASAYAEVMSRVTGRPVRFRHLPREVFAAFGFPGADDLASMFELNRLYIPHRARELEESRSLFPGLRSFDAWAEQNRERLLRAMDS